LTRAGALRTTADGMLVDGSGAPVLSGDPGRGYSPIRVRPDGGPVRATADGSIEQDGTIVATLSVVTVEGQTVESVGGAHYRAETDRLAATQPRLSVGHLEGSNVGVVRGMLDLIEVSHDYESAQKLMSESRKLDRRTLDTLA
jgi:flagellar basal body rod protein FlgG